MYSICSSNTTIVRIVSIVSLVSHIVGTSTIIVFINIDNPLIKNIYSGCSKVFLSILEVEKLFYSLYFVMDRE